MRHLRIALVPALAILVGITWIHVRANEKHPEPYTISPYILEQLDRFARPGDLLFRRGSGVWSQVFSRTSSQEGYFSHVGIVAVASGRLQVWHAEADDLSGVGGVKADTIEDYLKGAQGIAIARISVPNADLQRVAQTASSSSWQGIPFDTKFRIDDDGSAVYCTEYVWRVILDATALDVVPQKTVIGGIPGITVDDLLINPNVQTLYQKRWGSPHAMTD